MIFVTVGTHEQQFNRLIKEVDRLKKENIINVEVFIQTGYSDYEPKYCKFKNFLSYREMEEYMNKAELIVCHGGPATFMSALSRGKKLVVVPRLKKYEEHVNDHQIEFIKKASIIYPIEFVENIIALSNIVLDIKENKEYDNNYISNNKLFCDNLKLEIEEYF